MNIDKKIKAIKNFFEVKEKEIKHIEYNNFKVNGEVYMVLSESEADEEFYNYQINVMEDVGIDCFADWFKDEILYDIDCVDSNYFEECLVENYENLIQDLTDEELEEELKLNECENKDELLDYYINDYFINPIDWYIETFSYEEFENVCVNECLIDYSKVIEKIKEYDGRGCLATYDGEENDLGSGYYAYRLE